MAEGLRERRLKAAIIKRCHSNHFKWEADACSSGLSGKRAGGRYRIHDLSDIPYLTEDSEVFIRRRTPGRIRTYNSRGTKLRSFYLDYDGVEEVVGDHSAVVFYWSSDGYRRVVPAKP